MSKDQILRAFLKQRLTVEAREISEVFNRRFSQWEEELCRLHEDNERQRKVLEAVFNPDAFPADVQLLMWTKEGWSPGLDQYDHRPLHFKEELWSSEEDQGRMLRALVKQRLLTVAEHINELFDRTIAEYKKEICHSTHKNKRQQKLLDAVFKPKVLLHRAGCPMDVQQLAPNNKVSKGPESHPIKKQEEVMIKQEDEYEAETPPTAILIKTEEDKVKPPPSHFHHRRTEDGPDGPDLCTGSEPDRSLGPHPCFQTDPDDEVTNSSDTKDSDKLKTGPCFHHTGGKPFKCTICQKEFRFKSNIKRHMKTHTGEKPFTCSVCGDQFSRKSNLKDHHTACHSEVKPFTCSLCDKSFGCRNNYKKHMQRHVQEERPPSSRSAEGRPMKHNCSECGKTFRYASILKCHLRVHTGEKPFRCSVCEQSFARKAHLISHMFQHTGERPYTCAVCKKGFTRKDYVKVHMNIHTRKKSKLRRMNSSDGAIRFRVGDANALVHQYEEGGSELKCTRRD